VEGFELDVRLAGYDVIGGSSVRRRASSAYRADASANAIAPSTPARGPRAGSTT
jgi:hypothetical protein